MARKKIVLVIVEGPSDDTALGAVLTKLYDKNTVHLEILHGDITADYEIQPENIVKAITAVVKHYADSMHFKQIHFQEVIHIVDMDGAYIPDNHVIKDENAKKPVYTLTEITTDKPDEIIKRNAHKQEKINRMYKMDKVWKIAEYFWKKRSGD